MTNAPIVQHQHEAVGVISLVSEQALPNLAFLLHMAALYGRRLKFIGLYHTDDQRRSREPADRLSRVLVEWGSQRSLEFTVELFQGTGRADNVRNCALNWIQDKDERGIDHWVVNTTLGMKPMSTALYEAAEASGHRSVRVIYLEAGRQQWNEWMPNEDGLLEDRPLDAADPELPKADVLTAEMPLELLVASQFALEGATVRLADDKDLLDRPQMMPELLSWTQSAHKDGSWHWSRVGFLSRQGTLSDGNAFERYVLAGLHASGLRARRSLEVISDAGIKLLECDLVFVHKGRAYCLDLKLPSEDSDEERGRQLTKCATDARQLFGSAAQPIAIRPGWPREQTKVASDQAKALGVRLLTQSDMRSLFTALRAIIDVSLPMTPSLLETEDWLQKLEHLTVLSEFRRIKSRMEAAVYPMPEAVRMVMERTRQPWCLAFLHNEHYLLTFDLQNEAGLWGNKAPSQHELLHDVRAEASANRCKIELLWKAASSCGYHVHCKPGANVSGFKRGLLKILRLNQQQH